VSAYTDAVERGPAGMRVVSIGECPGCEKCAESHDMTPEEHRAAWQSGRVSDEGGFSNCRCGICGTRLAGDRYAWHWIDGGDKHGKGGTIVHESDACADCLLFLANGDEPESWP